MPDLISMAARSRRSGGLTIGSMAPADATPGRLASTLRSKRALLVLDNVVDAAMVRPILPTGGLCALIVIAPHRLALFDGVWTIDVPDLVPAALAPPLLAG